jgi:hypothetical protein
LAYVGGLIGSLAEHEKRLEVAKKALEGVQGQFLALEVEAALTSPGPPVSWMSWSGACAGMMRAAKSTRARWQGAFPSEAARGRQQAAQQQQSLRDKLEALRDQYALETVILGHQVDDKRRALVELVRSSGPRLQLAARRELQQQRVAAGWFEQHQGEAQSLLEEGKLDDALQLLGVELFQVDGVSDHHLYSAMILALAERDRNGQLRSLLKALVKSWVDSGDVNRDVLAKLISTVAQRNDQGDVSWLLSRLADAWLASGPANHEALMTVFSESAMLRNGHNHGATRALLAAAADEAVQSLALGPLRSIIEKVWSLNVEAIAAWKPDGDDRWPFRPAEVFSRPQMAALAFQSAWDDPRIPYFFGTQRDRIGKVLEQLNLHGQSLEFVGPNGPNDLDAIIRWLDPPRAHRPRRE